jgi:hypothetical protein
MPHRSRLALLAAAGVLSTAAVSAQAQDPYTMPPVVTTKTVAVPVVSITGGISRGGAIEVSEFRVQAAKGTVVKTSCTGKGCPFKHRSTKMKTTSLRLKTLERTLKPGITITVRAARPGELGKYLRYTVRAKQGPKRTDSCLLNGKVRNCFKG